jgi:hypothetical protein
MSSLLWAVGLIYCYCCARVVQGLDSAVVDATYRKIIPCILDNPAATGLTADSFKFPDDAEAHYQDLLNRTAKYRGHPTHYTKGFDGPWIENLWIENFTSKPLSYFGGLIPIFVQFVDIHVHSFMRMGPINNAAYKQLYHELGVDLKALLRPNVLYMAVSQDDESITFEDLFKTHPNILTLSAGGFGHIPIPLVKGIMNYKPVDINQPNSYKYKSGFYGAPQNGKKRKEAEAKARRARESTSYLFEGVNSLYGDSSSSSSKRASGAGVGSKRGLPGSDSMSTMLSESDEVVLDEDLSKAPGAGNHYF